MITKILGEMKTVQVMVMSIVIVHSKIMLVKVLGIVKIFTMYPLKLCLMIPMVTDNLIMVTILKLNISISS
jgi:hypothetical protein